MSVLVGELLQDAYLFAGIGDQYNPMDADSTNLALRFLNDLADSYSTDALKIYGIATYDVVLIPGQIAYSIGPGAPLSGIPVEPSAITSIEIRLPGVASYYVNIVGPEEFHAISFKGASGRPTHCWIDKPGDNTLELFFWPVPTSAVEVANLFMLSPLPQFTSVGDSFTAPPGYRLFFKTALGKVLASVNKIGLSADQKDVIAAAELTMKAMNARRRILGTDIPHDKMAGNWFNIFTGYPR